MSDDRPFALHITWTCYGCWLPGDPRGHVSNVRFADGGYLRKANAIGTPYRRRDDFTRQQAHNAQLAPSASLTIDLALIAAEALCEALQSRGWRILRGALMGKHVHVVVMDCPPDGPAVRRILKGTSQAALNDHVGRNTRWWTAGGSDRYKNDYRAIEAAVYYVANQEGKLAEIIDGRAAGFIPAVERTTNDEAHGGDKPRRS